MSDLSPHEQHADRMRRAYAASVGVNPDRLAPWLLLAEVEQNRWLAEADAPLTGEHLRAIVPPDGLDTADRVVAECGRTWDELAASAREVAAEVDSSELRRIALSIFVAGYLAGLADLLLYREGITA